MDKFTRRLGILAYLLCALVLIGFIIYIVSWAHQDPFLLFLAAVLCWVLYDFLKPAIETPPWRLW